MASCLFKLRGRQRSAWCPIRFLWCFLIASQPRSHSSAGLSVATAQRAKQHFTTMSVTSTLHTNQRVCQREAQLQRRKRREEVEKWPWRERERDRGKKKKGEEREAESVSHVASNFGSGSSTTLFHHRLLCYEHELAQDRRRDRGAIELAKTTLTK